MAYEDVKERDYRKLGLKRNKTLEGGWLTRSEDAELAVAKFVARWDVEPSEYRVLDGYIILGPIP